VANLKAAASAAVLRREIVALNHAGYSNEEIAAKKGCSTNTVRRHYHKFLEVDCKYPVGLDASQVDLMRAEQREHLESYQRRLAARRETLNKVVPADVNEEAMITTALCKLSDSNVRITDQLAGMFGLNAPTNNNTVNTQINILQMEQEARRLLGGR
jgi:Homeodomain-like domain